MVVIRLSRGGKTKYPFYHMVVTDSRNRRDGGNYIEQVGYYNPVARGKEVPLYIDLDKITHWQNYGAKLSDRVCALVKKYQKTIPKITIPEVVTTKIEDTTAEK